MPCEHLRIDGQKKQDAEIAECIFHVENANVSIQQSVSFKYALLLIPFRSHISYYQTGA
jgi:hypothetical protein